MLTDKDAKKKYREEYFRNPEKYYAVGVLKKEGFSRNFCESCKKPFWSVQEGRKICGDPGCGAAAFDFIGRSPAKRKMSYIKVWQAFSRMFRKFGYTPIKRYPVVARWNPTMDYTNASISAFQPHVVSGEIAPPAKRLVIPQLCFRTVDIDNVGITGSHNTVFCMIGQHAFVSPAEWDQSLAFEHIHAWLNKGIGIPNEEITFHEDAWAGGGNLGPCMEFFSRGNELGNQVYMMYEQTDSGIKELNLRVLDMGMGQERNAWFSQGTNTIYDASFPSAIKYLLKQTGLKFDRKLIGDYVPYGGMLNLDETDDISKSWSLVSEKTGCSAEELKKNVLPVAGMYSVGEHSRALLVMFNDGALPSNIGDAYNLRIILRRMLGFTDEYGWNIDVQRLFELHARFLRKQYPELSSNLDNVKKIFDVEQEKYRQTKIKSCNLISRIISSDIGTEELVRLYDSHGIPPELIRNEAEKAGKSVKVPENFYAMISEMHGKQEQKSATERRALDLGHIQKTRALYFDDYRRRTNRAKVLKILDRCVILDQTVAYPTSGGQMHDVGKINGGKFADVFRQGSAIIHVMKEKPKFREGDSVKVEIDIKRRLQIAKHHTATHIINEAARRVLGNHVNQASAFKDVDKAHLDITHYASITQDEMKKIENYANMIVKKSMHIRKSFVRRDVAEKKYGVRIYQGGAVPGKEIRIVSIGNVDVEACGGTHLDSTSEVGDIIITSVERVQDSVSRLTYVAGDAAKKLEMKYSMIVSDASKILCVRESGVIRAVKSLLNKWKSFRKERRKMIAKTSAEVAADIARNNRGKIAIELISGGPGELKEVSRIISERYSLLILLGNQNDKTFVWVASKEKNAGEIAEKICAYLNGKGGGSPLLGQGFGQKISEKQLGEIRKTYRSG